MFCFPRLSLQMIMTSEQDIVSAISVPALPYNHLCRSNPDFEHEQINIKIEKLSRWTLSENRCFSYLISDASDCLCLSNFPLFMELKLPSTCYHILFLLGDFEKMQVKCNLTPNTPPGCQCFSVHYHRYFSSIPFAILGAGNVFFFFGNLFNLFQESRSLI